MKMKSKKAQGLTIFMLLGLVIVAVFGMIYYTKVSEKSEINLELSNVDEKVMPLKNYIDNCYLQQQKAVLLRASIVQSIEPLEYYKTYFRQFVIDNSFECTQNIPEDLSNEFTTDPSVRDVKIVLPRDKTIFVLETKQKVIVDGENEKELGNYLQEHNVHFSKLVEHSEEISKSDKVRFDYLKQHPINNDIYRTEEEKQYILNDSISHIDFNQYLFLLTTP